MAQSAAIGIICKAPRAGRSKTRLAALIGERYAAGLSACFIQDVAAAVEAVPTSVGRQGYAVYAPAGAEAELRSVVPSPFGLLLKADTDLGQVLHGAARDLLARGHDCVLLVNSDSPTLPPSLLVEAIAALRRAGDRVVFGPAIDGGYYLVGLKAAHGHLFTDIPWGTADVTRLSLERAAEIGLEVVLLPAWYDVDDAETFTMLREELAGRPIRTNGNTRASGPAYATRAYLASVSFEES
jgi:rSAM/selenodomain-associated transferase 1